MCRASKRMTAECRMGCSGGKGRSGGFGWVCLCLCVKPMNKSVVSNSIWITAGGGGWLQLHYLTDKRHSTDGRVELKKVSALVKGHAAHRCCQSGWQVAWSPADSQPCAFLPESVTLCPWISQGCVWASSRSAGDALMSAGFTKSSYCSPLILIRGRARREKVTSVALWNSHLGQKTLFHRVICQLYCVYLLKWSL